MSYVTVYSTVKLRNEKGMSVTTEIFIVVEYQIKIDNETTSPIVEYLKKHIKWSYKYYQREWEIAIDDTSSSHY